MDNRKPGGFLSSLKDDLLRTLSPSPSRSRKTLLLTSSSSSDDLRHFLSSSSSSSSFRGSGKCAFPQNLSPLMEGPDPDGGYEPGGGGAAGVLGRWVKGQILRVPSGNVTGDVTGCKRPDLRVLLSVIGAPLSPVHVSSLDPLPLLSIKDTPIVWNESSSSSPPPLLLSRSDLIDVLFRDLDVLVRVESWWLTGLI